MPEWNWELIARHDNLTEGPAWDGEALLYTEIKPGLIWRWSPKAKKSEAWRSETNGGNGLYFDQRGRLFCCEGAGRRIGRYEKGKPAEVVVDGWQGKGFNEPNDLAITSDGRIYFSDPNYGGRPMLLDHESVWWVKPEGASYRLSRGTTDTQRPNGVLLSPDEKVLYVAESPRAPAGPRQLRAYPVQPDGSLGAMTVLHDFGPYRGIDGMAMTRGGVIVATAGFRQGGPGPMLYEFTPNGRVLATHPTPDGTDSPTNCTYGGARLDELFITFATGHVYRVTNTGYTGHLLWPR